MHWNSISLFLFPFYQGTYWKQKGLPLLALVFIVFHSDIAKATIPAIPPVIEIFPNYELFNPFISWGSDYVNPPTRKVLYDVFASTNGKREFLYTCTEAEITTLEGRTVLNTNGLIRLANFAKSTGKYVTQITLYIERVIEINSALAGDAGAFLNVGGIATILFTVSLLTGKYVIPEAVANTVPGFWALWNNPTPPLAKALLTNLQTLKGYSNRNCNTCVSGILENVPQKNNILNGIVIACNAAEEGSPDYHACLAYANEVNSLLGACGHQSGEYYKLINIGQPPDNTATFQQICNAPRPSPTPLPPPSSCPERVYRGMKYFYVGDLCNPVVQEYMINNHLTCDELTRMECTQGMLNSICYCASQACNVAQPAGKAFCGGSSQTLSSLTQPWDTGYGYPFSFSCSYVMKAYTGNYNFTNTCCPCGQRAVGPHACTPQVQRCVANGGSSATKTSVTAPVPAK